ncbi:hypothetical protein [Streptomyces sp. Inha503]|uniref:hypothetical protein n=1 Tax=Streptomyces sp. Inha503 TaxID=3383314 RepID=UPI0039A2961A
MGRFAYARPWYVIATSWLAVVSAVVALLTINPVKLSNEVRIDGTPAQDVIDDLATSLPEASGGQGMVAFRARNGTRVDGKDSRAALIAAVNAVYRHDHVIDARKVLADELSKGEKSPLLRARGAVGEATGQPTGGKAPTALQADGRPANGIALIPDERAVILAIRVQNRPLSGVWKVCPTSIQTGDQHDS